MLTIFFLSIIVTDFPVVCLEIILVAGSMITASVTSRVSSSTEST
jgi:hypothetical protein